MPDGTMMAASAMAGLERELELTAKNLANARTPGFNPRLSTTKSFESELDESGRTGAAKAGRTRGLLAGQASSAKRPGVRSRSSKT